MQKQDFTVIVGWTGAYSELFCKELNLIMFNMDLSAGY